MILLAWIKIRVESSATGGYNVMSAATARRPTVGCPGVDDVWCAPKSWKNEGGLGVAGNQQPRPPFSLPGASSNVYPRFRTARVSISSPDVPYPPFHTDARRRPTANPVMIKDTAPSASGSSPGQGQTFRLQASGLQIPTYKRDAESLISTINAHQTTSGFRTV